MINEDRHNGRASARFALMALSAIASEPGSTHPDGKNRMKAARHRGIDDRVISPARMPRPRLAAQDGQSVHSLESTAGATGAEPKPVSPRSTLAGAGFLLCLALLWVAAKWSGIPLPATCRVSPGALVFGVDTRVALATKADVSCPVPLRTPAATIDEVAVVSQPNHGVATTGHRTEAIYQAFREFHGEDAFTLAIRGHSRMYTGISILRVYVTVN
jgi:hypothetical protein